MVAWRSQHFLDEGRRAGIDQEILNRAVEIAEHTLRVPAPGEPILTLGHLAHMTGVDHDYLRATISRAGEDPYREFTIRKRSLPGQPPRLRYIAVPEPLLMTTQSWIASEILRRAPCHKASVAYAPGSRLATAAARHCKAKWLVKIDVREFFESITEIDAYRVFLQRGYQPLVSLELARLCTRLRLKHRSSTAWLPARRRVEWRWKRTKGGIDNCDQRLLGVLPQGAPTSPMLANLAAWRLDETVQEISDTFGVRYTRYADDLTFSSPRKEFGRARCIQLIGRIYQALGERGLAPNTAKTVLAPPGSRKMVLGLLVDGARPRLSKAFRNKLRMHLHFITRPDVGPARHAEQRGFTSIEGLRQHLLGLTAFATQIDPAYGAECQKKLRSAPW
ncbi:MAG: reverse transcriptase family protein [Minwuia sp.]|uniref:reverse transcriptase family protein n=1 Tax=Minwuia sp. TaxID=2493630 RepID=UPI003A898CFB